MAFSCFCYCWSLTLIHGGLIKHRELFQFFCICWDLICVQVCCYFWKHFYEMLKKMVCSFHFRWNNLLISVRSIWFIMPVSVSIICVYYFFLHYWVMDKWVSYWSLFLSVYECQYVILNYRSVSFINWEGPCVWGIHIKNWNVMLVDFSFDVYVVSFPISFD